MKQQLFRCIGTHVFTTSIHRFQNLIHIMTTMIKIRCKMASIQNEEDASKELDFKTQTEDWKIRNPTIKEEFVKVIKEFKIPVDRHSSILFRRNIFQKPVCGKSTQLPQHNVQICWKRNRHNDQASYKHGSLCTRHWGYHRHNCW